MSRCVGVWVDVKVGGWVVDVKARGRVDGCQGAWADVDVSLPALCLSEDSMPAPIMVVTYSSVLQSCWPGLTHPCYCLHSLACVVHQGSSVNDNYNTVIHEDVLHCPLSQDSDGNTALSLAARHGHAEVILALLQPGKPWDPVALCKVCGSVL